MEFQRKWPILQAAARPLLLCCYCGASHMWLRVKTASGTKDRRSKKRTGALTDEQVSFLNVFFVLFFVFLTSVRWKEILIVMLHKRYRKHFGLLVFTFLSVMPCDHRPFNIWYCQRVSWFEGRQTRVASSFNLIQELNRQNRYARIWPPLVWKLQSEDCCNSATNLPEKDTQQLLPTNIYCVW